MYFNKFPGDSDPITHGLVVGTLRQPVTQSPCGFDTLGFDSISEAPGLSFNANYVLPVWGFPLGRSSWLECAKERKDQTLPKSVWKASGPRLFPKSALKYNSEAQGRPRQCWGKSQTREDSPKEPPLNPVVLCY